MKKLIIVFVLLHTGYVCSAQTSTKIKDISVDWYCSPKLTQSAGGSDYYSCNYENGNGVFIFSVTINNLKSDLEKYDNVRGTYISSFLKKIEENTLNIGGKIEGKSLVANQSSVQYSEVTKVDSELSLKNMSASFVLGNNGYMINLVSNVENPKHKEEFEKLLKIIK